MISCADCKEDVQTADVVQWGAFDRLCQRCYQIRIGTLTKTKEKRPPTSLELVVMLLG